MSNNQTTNTTAAQHSAAQKFMGKFQKKPRKHDKSKGPTPRWKRILKWVLLAIAVLIIVGIIYTVFCIATAPKIDTSKLYDNLMESSIIYTDKGKKVDTVYSEENRTNVKYKDLPKNLVNAVVALEDKTFWDHHGFNFIRIMGAIKGKIFSGGQVSGTSTITQQLARNVFLKSSMQEHSMRRKIIEAWYTIQLERDLSKEQIMEAYLNTINLGFGSFGVESASEAYFSKSVNNLSLEQCVALASLPQAPSDYALIQLLNKDATPNANTVLERNNSGVYVWNDAGKPRREICLDLMLEQEYITKAQHDKAKKTSLKKILNPNFHMNDSTTAYFTDYLIEQVIKDLQSSEDLSYDEAWDKVYKGGLRIYSTMDRQAQRVIQKEFKNGANFPSQRNIRYDTKGNILNKYGRVMMYKYENYIKNGRFTFRGDEISKGSDGSLTIKHNKRLKIYKTSVNGKTDYSIEFPTFYRFMNGNKLYSISGGYINIPQESKTMDNNGNIVVSAKFVKSKAGKALFQKNKDGKYYISKEYYTINQPVQQPQASMTIIENETGQIKAMVGGRKTTGKMLYNRATEPRQPGSSIKPLAVYSAALQQSAEEAKAGKTHSFVNYGIDKQGVNGWGNYITARSAVIDEQTTNGRMTWPHNSGGGYSGYNTLRTALRKSLNTCAYKIWMQVGADYSANMVKKYGITTLVTKTTGANDMNAAALALGGMTHGVTSLEMANAYTTFPNNGTRAETPICYTKVTTSDGKTLLSKKAKKVRVLDSGVAWIMADMMKGVVSGGTGTAAHVYGIQAGGKTGTTSDEYDIWFDGFTPKYSAALWIGNDVNISLTSMSGYAAALWGKIMNQIPSAKTGQYKARPDDVQYIAGEYYVKGTYGGNVYAPNYNKKKKDDKKGDNNGGTTTTTTTTTGQ